MHLIFLDSIFLSVKRISVLYYINIMRLNLEYLFGTRPVLRFGHIICCDIGWELVYHFRTFHLLPEKKDVQTYCKHYKRNTSHSTIRDIYNNTVYVQCTPTRK